jgi:hypothetical protein
MSTKTKLIHAVIRVPHTMPARMYVNYPDRESDEYDSFWDDANSIHTFDNDDEIMSFLLKIVDSEYTFHQTYRMICIINEYFDNKIMQS